MRIIYNFSIWLYYFLAYIFSFFNKKAKKWITAQKYIFESLDIKSIENQKTAWFHAASLGEFEQGRTVIEEFKQKFPDFKIIVTFFSPSGYEIRKNYEKADLVSYLPIDTYRKAKHFIHIINPDIVFFIKYEFWFNYLKILYREKIPVYLISGIFRENQHFFRFYGYWFRKQLRHFNHFFVQNHSSVDLLKSVGFKNVSLSGDTRFDRVVQIAGHPSDFPLIEKFKNSEKLILIGSSWQAEEEIVNEFIKKTDKSLKFIFAPHEVDSERIKSLKNSCPQNSILFSELTEANYSGSNILIIDNIGILSSLYQYADIAIIGGGFGKGIHNILEAATFGVPVMFGPNYNKFSEALDLINCGGAFSFKNKDKFQIQINLLINDNKLIINSKMQCLNYIKNKKGATKKILDHIGL